MRKCTSVAKQLVSLEPGARLVPGTEILAGSAFVGGTTEGACSIPQVETKEECESAGGTWIESCVGGMEVFAPVIVGEDDMCAYAGEDGCSVLWPDSGDDLYEFDQGEVVPDGAEVIEGEVSDGDPTIAETDVIASLPAGQRLPKGFCADLGGDTFSDELMDLLSELADFEIPDLEGMALSGFIAAIAKLMSKLSMALGKIQMEVDKIIDLAKLDPDDICTPPVKYIIEKLLRLMDAYMKMMVILKKILQAIVLIRKIMKIIKKILKWITIPIPVVAVVEKLIDLLNLMGIVDMVISMVLGIVSRFVNIIPMLQAQLLAILAQCAAQVGQDMNSKEACEAAGKCLDANGNEIEVDPHSREACELAGGVWEGPEWIDPDQVNELRDMLEEMAKQVTGIQEDIEDTVSCTLPDGTVQEMTPAACQEAGGTYPGMDAVGFCSIPEHTTPEACAAAGGTWNTINTDTPLDEVDISALEKELQLQLKELNKCFQDPELSEYLKGL